MGGEIKFTFLSGYPLLDTGGDFRHNCMVMVAKQENNQKEGKDMKGDIQGISTYAIELLPTERWGKPTNDIIERRKLIHEDEDIEIIQQLHKDLSSHWHIRRKFQEFIQGQYAQHIKNLKYDESRGAWSIGDFEWINGGAHHIYSENFIILIRKNKSTTRKIDMRYIIFAKKGNILIKAIVKDFKDAMKLIEQIYFHKFEVETENNQKEVEQ